MKRIIIKILQMIQVKEEENEALSNISIFEILSIVDYN
jgi:hypothetical protein